MTESTHEKPAALGAPFNKLFKGREEAEWFFDEIEQSMKALGVTSVSDSLFALTLPVNKPTIRLNVGRWLVFGRQNAVNRNAIFIVALSRDAAETIGLKFDAAFGDKKNLALPKKEQISLFEIPDEIFAKHKAFIIQKYHEALGVARLIFQDYSSTPYRNSHQDVLGQMAFDRATRQKTLTAGFKPSEAVHGFVISEEQMARLWDRFHRRIEGFESFEKPGKVLAENELDYKRKALRRYREELGNDGVQKLLDEGKPLEALKALARIVSTNMIAFQSWRVSFGDDPTTVKVLLSAFLNVASKPYRAPADLKPIFDAYAKTNLRPAWDTLSTILWAMRPDDFCPMKISYFRDLADEVGHDLPSGSPDPEKFAEVMNFCEAFWNALEPQRPGDWVDVHSFIWCVCPSSYTEEADPSPVVDDPEKPFVDEDTMPARPLNLILYGPPGTGKTFTTFRRAVEIIDGKVSDNDQAVKKRFDELIDQSRIGFVTFHQSYSYEDFVEGIRPVTDDASGGEAGSPRYVCRDGLFKLMCLAAAAKSKGSKLTESVDWDRARFWKVSLGQAADPDDDPIYDSCLERNEIAIGWGKSLDFSPCDSRTKVEDRLKGAKFKDDESPASHARFVDIVRNQMQRGDFVIVTDGRHKFRALGRIVGDYAFQSENEYKQTRSVQWLRIFEQSQPKERILPEKMFSLPTVYRLDNADLNITVIRELLGADSVGTPGNYVLVIDEINRGNISKIFGELITLVEDDKRTGGKWPLSVKLPYSQKAFSVPSNLYIVGTMNTADKSIALVDVALRRRFTFEELMPNHSLIKNDDARKVITEMNRRITLRKDRDHQVGHSYFMHADDLNAVFRQKVFPLLQEYFYNDWDGLRFVLGEPADSKSVFICALSENSDGKWARNKWAWFFDVGKEIGDCLAALKTNYFPPPAG